MMRLFGCPSFGIGTQGPRRKAVARATLRLRTSETGGYRAKR